LSQICPAFHRTRESTFIATATADYFFTSSATLLLS
jgi:hypothetical protein